MSDLFYVRSNAKCDQSGEEEEESVEGLEQEEDGEDLESILQRLEEKQSKLISNISLIVDKKSIAKGVWNEQNRMVEHVYGKHLKQYVPSGNNCLNQFEALFLMECRSLAIFHKTIPLSIEDAYQMLLGNIRQQKLYKIFSVLSRVGYYVTRPAKTSKSIENASEINIINPGSKRNIEQQEEDIALESKRISISNENYSVINNIRPLKLSQISKINKIDKELIEHYNQTKTASKSSSNSSYLYCVKKSSLPVPISPLLSGLHDPSTAAGLLNPVIKIGSIYNTDRFFETIQTKAPKNGSQQQQANRSMIIDHDHQQDQEDLKIDFVVHSSRKHQQQQPTRPLFSVIVLDDDNHLNYDCLVQLSSPPSEMEIDHANNNNNIYYAILSPTLNYNFYHLNRFNIKNKYPRLWERDNRPDNQA